MAALMDLLPCPFCGGEGSLQKHRIAEDAMIAFVNCVRCGVQTEHFEDAYAPTADAIAAWNHRLAHSEPRPVAEALQRLVHDVDDLIGNSEGVYGLHPNGDLSPWDEIDAGGRSEPWLGEALTQAREALATHSPAQTKAGLIRVTDDKGFITLHEPDEDGNAGDLVASVWRDDWLDRLASTQGEAGQ